MDNDQIRIKEFTFRMEESANRFKLRCLAVLSFVAAFCDFCNYAGIFAVDVKTMNIAVASAFISFSIPAAENDRGVSNLIIP